MSDALVTGVAGFLGSHVAESLLGMGMTVVGIDNLSSGDLANVPDGVSFVQADICDVESVSTVFSTHHPRYVFHLAAFAAECLSHWLRRLVYDSNVIGSAVLINECVRCHVECVVFASSIAVYGDADHPMKETDRPVPIDPYGISKLAVEHDLAAARRLFGLQSVVFRPHNVYGERQSLSDPSRNVVGIFMNQIMGGRPLTVFGDGQQRRQFTYVKDIVSAIAGAVLRPEAHGQVVNCGIGDSHTIVDLVDAVRSAMGAPDHPVVHLPPRDEVCCAEASHELFDSLFPGSRTNLGEGLARMASWAKGRGPQVLKSLPLLEIPKCSTE